MKKKIALAVMALVLVCAVSALSTIAYLTKTSNSVTNTFVATEGLIDNPQDEDPTGNGFFIVETDASEDAEEGDETIVGNSYIVTPGVDIDKDAAVRVTGKTDVASYVIIEVLADMSDKLTYTVDSASWVDLETEGPNGGDLYVYYLIVDEDMDDVAILDGNKITVADDYDPDEETDPSSLEFYGYMCQEAGFEAASDSDADFIAAAIAAFNACFAD